MTDRTHPLPPPLGWAILDKHGIVTEWRVRLRAFFGGVLENAAPDSDHIARRDRESPGIAPHRVVAVYDEDTADTARRLLAERDAQVAALQAELAAERARADMHADLGRRTAEALGIVGDRSHMPEAAAALQAENAALTDGLDAALEFAVAAGGGAAWWDDVWPEHEAAIDAARGAKGGSDAE